MKTLPPNYSIENYGMQIRLVEETDADFIVELRTNEKLARYINATSVDISTQKEWIRAYKNRECEGMDYYFIYYYHDEPIGLNRLYDITEDTFVGGSFVFKSGVPFELPILATLNSFDIAFNVLDKKTAFGDIRKGNKKVIRFHNILEVEFTSNDDDNLYYKYSKEVFNKKKNQLEHLLINR